MVYPEHFKAVSVEQHIAIPETSSRPTVSRFAASMGLALIAMTAGTAHSAEDMFHFSGFGTVGVTHSSNENGDYVSTLFSPKGAGRSHDYDLGVDSRLGGQVTGTLTDSLSVVLQVVAQQRGSNHFSPRVEWANVKYAITPDLSVRVGRIAIAPFMIAESRMVGYSNPWTRPPIETYSVLPISNSDGVDVTYRHRIAAATNTVQVSYGKNRVDTFNALGARNQVEVDDGYAVIDTLELGALTARLGYTRGDFTLRPSPAIVLEGDINLINAGASYDAGDWFVMGEYSRRKLQPVLRTVKMGYVTAGTRFGPFTPYVTYSQVRPDDDQVTKAGGFHQSTSSGGVRWDVRSNVAVKLQYDRVKLGKGSSGLFTNIQPGLAGSSSNLLSLNVDFLF